MMLALVILLLGSAVYLSLAPIRDDRLNGWLFCMGVLSWVGVLAFSSEEVGAALKISSPTFFLTAFTGSLRHIYAAIFCPAFRDRLKRDRSQFG
jgi:hypothetical protein